MRGGGGETLGRGAEGSEVGPRRGRAGGGGKGAAPGGGRGLGPRDSLSAAPYDAHDPLPPVLPPVPNRV